MSKSVSNVFRFWRLLLHLPSLRACSFLCPHHNHSLPHCCRLHLLPALPQHPPHLLALLHQYRHRLLWWQAERNVLLQLWPLFTFVFRLLHHPKGELVQQSRVLPLEHHGLLPDRLPVDLGHVHPDHFEHDAEPPGAWNLANLLLLPAQ